MKQPMMDEVDRDAATKELQDNGEIVNRDCITMAHNGRDFFTWNSDWLTFHWLQLISMTISQLFIMISINESETSKSFKEVSSSIK